MTDRVPWIPPSHLHWLRDQADRENVHPAQDRRYGRRPEHDDFTMGSSERGARVSADFAESLSDSRGKLDGKDLRLIPDPVFAEVIYGEFGQDDGPTDADMLAISDRNVAELREAMTRLTNRQRDVIELRYGLRQRRALTRAEVALVLGISKQAVAKIEKAGLAALNADERVCAACGGAMTGKRQHAK